MRLETKLNILKKIQPTCEDIGFIIGFILASSNPKGGAQGIDFVKRRFDSYYRKHQQYPQKESPKEHAYLIYG